jgi:hypothetical protein
MPTKPSRGGARALLRSLPVDRRAEALVALFRFVASEFAALVLEHAKPPRPARRAASSSQAAKVPRRRMGRRP